MSVVFMRDGTGEDKRYQVQAMPGELLKIEANADEPFLTRRRSGEAPGDGGLVVAMFWGLALVLLAIADSGSTGTCTCGWAGTTSAAGDAISGEGSSGTPHAAPAAVSCARASCT